MRWEAVVVAPLHHAVVGVRPYERYFQSRFGQRQQSSVVLQQHDALLGHAQCQVAVLLAVNDAVRYFAPGHILVELSKLYARLHQACNGGVKAALAYKFFVYGVNERAVAFAALKVGSARHRLCRGVRRVRFGVVMPFGVEVGYRPAVRHHDALEAPFVAQYLL